MTVTVIEDEANGGNPIVAEQAAAITDAAAEASAEASVEIAQAHADAAVEISENETEARVAEAEAAVEMARATAETHNLNSELEECRTKITSLEAELLSIRELLSQSQANPPEEKEEDLREVEIKAVEPEQAPEEAPEPQPAKRKAIRFLR